MKILERRFVPVAESGLRMIRGKNGDPDVLEGYSAKFNVLSDDLGGFREKIEPGAFKGSLDAGADVRALWNHNSDFPLGRRSNKTLEIKEDETGLFMRNVLPETDYARNLAALVDRGDVREQSFAFYTISDKWEKVDGNDLRTLLEVDLIDVSPVTYPAYSQTDIALRSYLASAGVDERIAKAIMFRTRGIEIGTEEAAGIAELVEKLNRAPTRSIGSGDDAPTRDHAAIERETYWRRFAELIKGGS